MARILISYRRDDSAESSGRIDDRLAPKYGRENVFKDVDTIPLGVDFRQVLDAEVGLCDVMLVVIGRQWASITDEAGCRRLESPTDFVRIEVEAALARNIPVIPVLVQNAAMPQERDLPSSLAPLAFRNGITVRGDPHFHSDMDLLIRRLDALFTPAQVRSPPAQTPLATPESTRKSDGPMRVDLPKDHFPARLEQLGFTGYKNGAEEYILPPQCEIPFGTFLMGSDPKKDKEANRDRESPQGSVTLGAYQIAKYPVTVAEYVCFVRATGHAEPRSPYNQLTWAQQRKGRLDHPVVNVSWHDVVAYTQWLAEQTGQPWRLPSEAEWEKAARGTDGRLYPWGDAFDANRCNTSEGNKGTTTPVDSFPDGASPYGALDMAGNVWEWTSTIFKPYPYSATDGRERAESPENRVQRGGSWGYVARYARAACRSSDNPPDFVLGTYGFRVVCALQ